MADINTILIVDDERDKHGFYWQIFNPNEQEFDPPFLPPDQNSARTHPLHIEYFGVFDEFERIFAAKVSQGKRYPLAIVDMRLRNHDGSSEERRGLKTALLVRQLDKDVSIVVATHAYDLEEEEIRAQLGENSFLFRLYELDTRAKLDAFVGTVHALVDRWNDKRKMLGVFRNSPEKVPVSELVRKACEASRGERVQLEPYINPGLEVMSYRQPLTDGVEYLVRYAVERSAPNSSVSLFCESSPAGAVLSASYQGAENDHLALEHAVREGSGADGLGLYLFRAFLSSGGGSLKIGPGLAGRGTTITANIHHV